MKLSLISLVLPLVLAGCAGTFGDAPKVPKPMPVEVAPPKPATVDVDRPLWSMSLPEGWIVKPGGPKVKGQVTQALVARSPDMVGRAPIVIAVMEIALDPDDPKDEDFGAVIAIGAKQTSEVIAAVPKPVDGKPGSLVMLTTPGGLLIVQEAVGYKRTGFVIRCGGDMAQGDKIIDRCTSLIENFHTK